MIGMVGHDHTACTGFSACQSQCQFIGFGSGTGEHRDIEATGKLVC